MTKSSSRFKLHIGWRTIKTVISVTVTCGILALMDHNTATLGALAAVFGLRTSNQETFKYGIYRILGNIIGITLAVILAQLSVHFNLYGSFIYQTLGTGLGILLVIILSNLTNLSSGIVTASASFLVVYLSIPPHNLVLYGFNRIIETVTGSIVAIIINYIFPNPTNPQESHLIELYDKRIRE